MQGEQILIIGHGDWGIWRQTHEFAYRFTKKNRSVFVERIRGYEVWRWRGDSCRDYWGCFHPQGFRWVDKSLAVIDPPPMVPRTVSILSRAD